MNSFCILLSLSHTNLHKSRTMYTGYTEFEMSTFTESEKNKQTLSAPKGLKTSWATHV